jgi:hypothetical protein
MSSCFQLKDAVSGKRKKLRGLKPLLEKVFWPDYQFVRHDHRISTGAGGAREGQMRGTLVHSQVKDYTNKPFKVFKARHSEDLQEYTKQLLIQKKNWGNIVGAAEVPLYDSGLMIGTATDEITYDISKPKEIIMYEWKIGFDGYFNQGSGPMHGILGGVLNNSPFNQACVQLLFNYIFLKITLGIEADKLYVVCVNKDGVNREPVPEVLLKNVSSIYKFFAKRLAELDAIEREEKEKVKELKKKKKKEEKEKSKKRKIK